CQSYLEKFCNQVMYKNYVKKNPVVGEVRNVNGEKQNFLANLGKIFIFNRIGSVFMMFILIWAARVLGPSEFGKIGLINNIANFLVIPLVFGVNNAMYKFLPNGDPTENLQLRTAAFAGNCLLSVFWLMIYFGLASGVEMHLHIPHRTWELGIYATIAMNYAILCESFIRGQKQFDTISWLKLLGNVIFFLLFLLSIWLLSRYGVEIYFIPFFISQMVFGVFALLKSGFVRLPVPWAQVKKVYSYGFLTMLNSVLTVILFSSDIFIINYFLSGVEVGIYSVYQGFAKGMFSALFYEVFAVVFLPVIAKMDTGKVYRVVNQVAVWVVTGVTMAMAGINGVIVGLTGKNYGLDWRYIFLVAVGMGFYTLFQVYNSLLSMEGNKGACWSLLPIGVVLPFSLAGQYYFTQFWGVTGAIIAVTLTYFLLVVVFKLVFHRTRLGFIS
ncbi:MAG TPA: oligosaccharide flippase family protein, partial [Bacillota bacterium]|nr:oligosaccharide flippase family protein [Bacillota bacterium]